MYHLISPPLALTFALAALGLASPAFAIGGLCGGVTPCACGDKLVDSRNLVHNLDPITTTVCPGDGLIVDGSMVPPPRPNITLNLRSQTLRGRRGVDNVGVRVTSYSGFTVTDGTITGFATGVEATDVNRSHFTNLRLVANNSSVLGQPSGGISVDGDTNTIASNQVTRIECAAFGIAVEGEDNTVTLNRVEFNSFDDGQGAIQVRSTLPESSTVSRNIVRRSVQCRDDPPPGFQLRNAKVSLNRSEDNDGDGFRMEGPGLLTRNTAIRNGSVPDVDEGTLGSGFRVGCGSELQQNRADYSGAFGILSSEARAVCLPNTFKLNVCSGTPTVLDGTGTLKGGGTATIAVSGKSAVLKTFDDPRVCLDPTNPECMQPVLDGLCK